MAKAPEKNVAVVDNTSYIPAHILARMQSGEGKASLGNIDRSDLIIPRVKLLQGISPEIETFEAAKAGQFWHTIGEQPLGTQLNFIPILVKKTYVLWAPRGDERGILARANDGVNWDVKDKFEVKPKNSRGTVVWDTTAGTVAASGLGEFGTSNPDIENSAPAASLTFNILAYFPDFEDFSPALMLNTRSAVKAARGLISKLEASKFNHYERVFTVSSSKEVKDGDTFLNYVYTANGFASEEHTNLCKELYERYREADFKANDEEDTRTENSGNGGGGAVNEKMASKF